MNAGQLDVGKVDLAGGVGMAHPINLRWLQQQKQFYPTRFLRLLLMFLLNDSLLLILRCT